MTIERGVKRILTVVSVLGVVGWTGWVVRESVTYGWSEQAHHTVVEAWCDPARHSTYEVRQSPEQARRVGGQWIPGCHPDSISAEGERVLQNFRTKYPGMYGDLNDQQLATAILKKWPVYQDVLGSIACRPPRPARGLAAIDYDLTCGTFERNFPDKPKSERQLAREYLREQHLIDKFLDGPQGITWDPTVVIRSSEFRWFR